MHGSCALSISHPLSHLARYYYSSLLYNMKVPSTVLFSLALALISPALAAPTTSDQLIERGGEKGGGGVRGKQAGTTRDMTIVEARGGEKGGGGVRGKQAGTARDIAIVEARGGEKGGGGVRGKPAGTARDVEVLQARGGEKGGGGVRGKTGSNTA